MAETVRSYTLTEIKSSLPGVAWLCTWSGLDSDDSGDPLEMTAWSDRSVQVSGTFGSGGSITMQGSNDGTNWCTLTDGEGNNVTLAAATTIHLLKELPRFIRPLATSGDGSTDLNVYLVLSGYKRAP